MKSIVLYSTRTGNTKMVAEAIASALPEGTPCRNIREMNESLSDYDCVFMGFWVDKGTADDASRKVLENLHNRHVAVFAASIRPAAMHRTASRTAPPFFRKERNRQAHLSARAKSIPS